MRPLPLVILVLLDLLTVTTALTAAEPRWRTYAGGYSTNWKTDGFRRTGVALVVNR